ncbi:MAG: acyl-CoA dehydrogenase family protein, partial [Gemmatimonadota bacterium]|nr:acyl-CoA dehydrogenase family protein [Gemmatimonadota bacterium]
MEPYLGPDHARLRDGVRSFALEHIAPVAAEIDRTQTFPWENVRAMGEMGLLGVPIPEEYGGMGCDYLSYILVVEELARHDA